MPWFPPCCFIDSFWRLPGDFLETSWSSLISLPAEAYFWSLGFLREFLVQEEFSSSIYVEISPGTPKSSSSKKNFWIIPRWFLEKLQGDTLKELQNKILEDFPKKKLLEDSHKELLEHSQKKLLNDAYKGFMEDFKVEFLEYWKNLGRFPYKYLKNPQKNILELTQESPGGAPRIFPEGTPEWFSTSELLWRYSWIKPSRNSWRTRTVLVRT